MARGLHHLEIYVSDLEKSKVFWGWFLEKLDYKKFQEWKKGVSWKIESTYLVFVQTEEKYLSTPYHRCQSGLNHLAFHAASKTQVDQIASQLKEKKAKILYEEKHPYAGGREHYALYFEDPDRIKVELVAPSQ